MTTIASRRRQYLDRTLDSLFASDGRDLTINLILGSPDTSHVERYRDVVHLVIWDADAQARARPDQLRHNCTVNALRALRYGADEECLCCEDDIKFAPDWLSRLRMTIAEIPHDDYVLNLGQGGSPPSDKRYATHTRPYLCGAQAIYYPTKAFRERVADYVEENIRRGMNDELIGRFAKEHAALYNTIPPLVVHIGQVSTFEA